MVAELENPPEPLTLATERLRMLVYGEFGRGKTTFASSFPAPLIIDTNGGLVSIALNGSEAAQFEPAGYEDLESLYFWIKEHSADFDTIVIDSLDSLTYLLMDEITDDAVLFKKSEGKKVSMRMQFVPEQGDYFASQRQMNRFLVGLRQLGKHIIITSSLRYKNGRSSPNVSDGMERVVCDFVSVTGELIILDEVSEDDDDTELYEGCRVLLTNESNARATKSRFGSLKPYVVDPTFDKLWSLIEGEVAEAQSKRKSPAAKRRTTTRKR